jgi:hypothetical protein
MMKNSFEIAESIRKKNLTRNLKNNINGANLIRPLRQ